MTRTQKLAKISLDLSNGVKFVKLRCLIEDVENDANVNPELLARIDDLLDTFNKLLDFSNGAG